MAEQNLHTDGFLHDLASRAVLRDTLGRLLRVGSSVAPQVAGTRLFTLERWGHHEQAVLVVRSATSTGRARTLVDPAEADR